MSLCYTTIKQSQHTSVYPCASVYPSVINKLYSVGTMSFTQLGERGWEENEIQMKGFFFLILIDCQNVNGRPFLKLS